MCLTSDAVYRIRDADAIFRIERKDDQKIAQKSKLFYRKYFVIIPEVSVAPSGESFRNTFFFCAWFSRFTVGVHSRSVHVANPARFQICNSTTTQSWVQLHKITSNTQLQLQLHHVHFNYNYNYSSIFT